MTCECCNTREASLQDIRAGLTRFVCGHCYALDDDIFFRIIRKREDREAPVLKSVPVVDILGQLKLF